MTITIRCGEKLNVYYEDYDVTFFEVIKRKF